MVHQHLFIDFEFTMPETGVREKGYAAEIIEVGVVSTINGEVDETFRSFVQPKWNPILSERCKSFLNLAQSDVDLGISFIELAEKLQSLYRSEQTMIVTWGNMDMYVLKKSCEKWEIEFPFRQRELDLSIEYMRFYGERNQTGLMKAFREYGHQSSRQHHSALDDALTTYEIYLSLERDKQYLQKPATSQIGDLVDLNSLREKLA